MASECSGCLLRKRNTIYQELEKLTVEIERNEITNYHKNNSYTDINNTILSSALARNCFWGGGGGVRRRLTWEITES